MGSGILGNLAAGAAVGAGLIAGEALMHKVIDGHSQDDSATTVGNSWEDNSQLPYDLGGDSFGISDDTTSWDDSGVGGGDDWG